METSPDFGPYEVESPLSGGAMGTIYRARHSRGGEVVALKSVALPVRVQIASLRREIQALQSVEHPNIVRIYEHGADPMPWYAMELVEGLPLSKHFQSTRDDRSRWRDYASAMCDVCNGLSYLHGLGMVHRDLKPANILIREGADGAPGRAVLVDFGLATVSAGGVGRELLYKRSDIVGTPQYIAPEQVCQETVDARTDLYALGCILFELLVGEPPFPAAMPFVGMLRHVNDEPVIPPQVASELPADLVELVLSLLAKPPHDCPGYAVDVRDALAAIAGVAVPKDVPEPAPYLYRSRLVGREPERSVIEEVATRFVTGDGGLVVIRGAAGAGKSRIAIDLIRRVHILHDAGVEVLLAESTADCVAGPPFESLRRVFDEIADYCVERGAKATLDLLGMEGVQLGRVVGSFASLPGIADVAPPLLPACDFEDRLCESATAVLRRFARIRPLAVVIDDLQWCDSLTRRWLAGLQWHRLWDDAPVLVIVCGRYGDFLLDALAHHDDATVLKSKPLDATAVEEMIRDMIAVDEVPAEFSHAVATRSTGYPSRVTEWLHEAVRRGVLARSDGEWRFAGRTLDERGISDTVSIEAPFAQMVRHRIARLDDELRDALHTLAASGVVVSATVFEALRASSPRVDELVAAEFLEEIGRGDLRFVGETTRDTIFEGLDHDAKVRAHRALAAILDSVGADAAVLAKHVAAGGDTSRAAKLLEVAAEEASRRGEAARAERLYAQYFEMFDDSSEIPIEVTAARIEARARWAQALRASADSVAAEATLAQAEAELAEHDSPEARAVVRRIRGAFLRGQNENTEAIGVLDEAYRLFMQLGRAVDARDALIDIGNCWCRQGRFEVGRDVFQRALDSATAAGDIAGIATARTSVGMTFMSTRQYGEAVEALSKAAAEFQQANDVVGQSNALLHLGQSLADVGRAEEAIVALHGAYEVRYAIGNTRGAAAALLHLGHAYLQVGHTDQAIEALTAAITALETASEPVQLAVAHGYLGEALGVLRRVDEAMEHFVAALNLHRSMPHSALEPYVHLEIGKLHRRLGLYNDAQHHYRLAAEKAEDDAFFDVARALEEARFELAQDKASSLDATRIRAWMDQMNIGAGSPLAVALRELEAAILAPAAERLHGELRAKMPIGFRQ